MNRWPSIFLGVLLAGCAHFEPQPISPADSAAKLDARRLDDPGLRQFLEANHGYEAERWPPIAWDFQALTLTAFYFHPSLEVARAQWRVAEAGVKTAGGRPNPTLGVTPGYNTTTLVPSPWFPAVNFDLPVETAGKRGKRVTEARKLSESARWNIIATAWRVRSNLRASLLDFTAANKRTAILSNQAFTQERIVKLLQQRFDTGGISRPELTTAQIALHKAQLDLADAELKRAEGKPRLAESLGLSADALDGAEFAFEFPEPADDLTSAEARRVALQSRSDILGALADYAAAEADLRLQIAKQFPDVHFNPGYQFDQGDNKWSLGISVELPVLNQNQGPIAEAEARRKLAAAKFTALQAQVIGEIDRAVAGWRATRGQKKTGDALLAASQRQIQSVQAQAQAGAADQLDLLNSFLESNSASLVQLENEARLQRAVSALEDAVQRSMDAMESSLIEQPGAQARKENKP